MKDSNSTEKGKCKVKYTINKIKLQQMSGTEFKTKKNIWLKPELRRKSEGLLKIVQIV